MTKMDFENLVTCTCETCKAKKARLRELVESVRDLLRVTTCPCDYDPEEGPCESKRLKNRIVELLDGKATSAAS